MAALLPVSGQNSASTIDSGNADLGSSLGYEWKLNLIVSLLAENSIDLVLDFLAPVADIFHLVLDLFGFFPG